MTFPNGEHADQLVADNRAYRAHINVLKAELFGLKAELQRVDEAMTEGLTSWPRMMDRVEFLKWRFQEERRRERIRAFGYDPDHPEAQ